MSKKVIKTSNAPQPIGPYNQAIAAGGFLFLSGQIAIDPNTGNLVGEDLKLQTSQVIKNLEAVLQAAGVSLNAVIKTTIFLTNMDDFPTVNAIYNDFFTDSAPARSTVEVSRLPKDVLIEIDCIAMAPGS